MIHVQPIRVCEYRVQEETIPVLRLQFPELEDQVFFYSHWAFRVVGRDRADKADTPREVSAYEVEGIRDEIIAQCLFVFFVFFSILDSLFIFLVHAVNTRF